MLVVIRTPDACEVVKVDRITERQTPLGARTVLVLWREDEAKAEGEIELNGRERVELLPNP